MKEGFETSCKGNYYRTTLHSLNSLVVKCSKLTKTMKVYRGSARGVLPISFWEEDKDGVRGGVEAGFMSTSCSREVAIGYASTGSTPMVFEIAQGMINRGAELGWLSQYPHEEEGKAHSCTLYPAAQPIQLIGTLDRSDWFSALTACTRSCHATPPRRSSKCFAHAFPRTAQSSLPPSLASR